MKNTALSSFLFLAMILGAFSGAEAQATCGTAGADGRARGTAEPVTMASAADGSGYYVSLRFSNPNPGCVENVWFTDKSTLALFLSAESMGNGVYVIYQYSQNTFFDITVNYKLLQANLVSP